MLIAKTENQASHSKAALEHEDHEPVIVIDQGIWAGLFKHSRSPFIYDSFSTTSAEILNPLRAAAHSQKKPVNSVFFVRDYWQVLRVFILKWDKNGKKTIRHKKRTW